MAVNLSIGAHPKGGNYLGDPQGEGRTQSAEAWTCALSTEVSLEALQSLLSDLSLLENFFRSIS